MPQTTTPTTLNATEVSKIARLNFEGSTFTMTPSQKTILLCSTQAMTDYQRKAGKRCKEALYHSMEAGDCALFLVFQLAKAGKLANLDHDQQNTLQVLMTNATYAFHADKVKWLNPFASPHAPSKKGI